MKKALALVLSFLIVLLAVYSLLAKKPFVPEEDDVKNAYIILNDGKEYQLNQQDTKTLVHLLQNIKEDKRYEVVGLSDIMAGFKENTIVLKTNLNKFTYTFSGFDLVANNKRWRINIDYFTNKCFPILLEIADHYKIFGGEICDPKWAGTVMDVDNNLEYDINEILFYPAGVINKCYVKTEPVDFDIRYIVHMKNILKEYTIQIGEKFAIVDGIYYQYDESQKEGHSLIDYIIEQIASYKR